MSFLRMSLCMLMALWSSAVLADPPAPTRKDSAQLRWLDATVTRRAAIVDAWRMLPETTRPPFSQYREKALGQPAHDASPPVMTTAAKTK